jgi:SNF2 family DNA or RNA helicase
MEQFHTAEELAARDGLTFAEAMRMLAGAGVTRDDPAAADTGWARVTAGPWLEQTLKELRAPDGDGVDPGPALQGTLRPYQKAGTRWMDLLAGLGLGACLADDMGLVKTI